MDISDRREKKMIKVLLVDDEILAIEYLENIIDWQQLGFKVVARATHGKQAIAYLRKYSVDLIISDIKMPVMDGIDLAKFVQHSGSGTKIILVSAYRDFQYAKSALKYGVTNYLLKHELTKSAVEEEVLKIKESLEKEAQFKRYNQKDLFEKLIYKKEISSVELQSFYQEGLKNFYMVLLTMNMPLGEKQERICNQFDCILAEEEWDKWKSTCLVELQVDANHRLILSGTDKKSELQMKEQINTVLQSLFTCAKKKEMYDLRVLYVTLAGLDKINIQFRELAMASRYSRFMCFGKVYTPYDLPIVQATEEEKLRLNAILERPTKSIEEVFEIIGRPVWKLELLKEAIKRLDKPKVEKGFKDYRELVEAYKEASEKGEKQYSILVQGVLEYIYEHYSSGITLQDLGEKLGMNGVYIGQVFKKEMGMTVLHYLKQYRLKKAKEMLKNTSLSIHEISCACGYSTSQYFSTLFTREVGRTPQVFRKWG